MSEYTDRGYKNRSDYVVSLAEEHGIPAKTALLLAVFMGPEEDFDLLVATLEDLETNSVLRERIVGKEVKDG